MVMVFVKKNQCPNSFEIVGLQKKQPDPKKKNKILSNLIKTQDLIRFDKILVFCFFGSLLMLGILQIILVQIVLLLVGFGVAMAPKKKAQGHEEGYQASNGKV